jgi:hypothetical protein
MKVRRGDAGKRRQVRTVPAAANEVLQKAIDAGRE